MAFHDRMFAIGIDGKQGWELTAIDRATHLAKLECEMKGKATPAHVELSIKNHAVKRLEPYLNLVADRDSNKDSIEKPAMRSTLSRLSAAGHTLGDWHAQRQRAQRFSHDHGSCAPSNIHHMARTTCVFVTSHSHMFACASCDRRPRSFR